MWKTMWKKITRDFIDIGFWLALFVVLLLVGVGVMIVWKVAEAQTPTVVALEGLRRPTPGISAAKEASTLLLNLHRTHLIALRGATDGTIFYDHVGNKYIWDAEAAAGLETQITEVEGILSRLE